MIELVGKSLASLHGQAIIIGARSSSSITPDLNVSAHRLSHGVDIFFDSRSWR